MRTGRCAVRAQVNGVGTAGTFCVAVFAVMLTVQHPVRFAAVAVSAVISNAVNVVAAAVRSISFRTSGQVSF